LAPVMIGLAVAIAIVDGRPVLFRQTRIGRFGRPFLIWKFRTMRAGNKGSSITSGGDARITPIGLILRRYKLDELPQLVNVLRGEMSLVGPRPEVPEYVRFKSPIWQAVLNSRPGITDLASLVYRDEEELLRSQPDPEAYYRDHLQIKKLGLNLAYASHRNLWRDVRLILSSIRYSLFPEQFNSELVYRTFADGGRYEPRIHPVSCTIDR
jgi:lipopolysaccharide/colanic/teichoic acid biosynthesis glycosyltransferase